VRLLFNLASLWSRDELDQLATDLCGRPEEIQGDTVFERAESLIEWAERNNELMALMAMAISARPDAKWK
jgi:hypothetical protein